MSEQANSERFAGSRRAMMLGAAAVGAGAMATVAGASGVAMAATEQAAPKGAVAPARKVTVKLPPTAFNIDETFRILQSVLSQVGCAGCYSGWDINFVHETEFVVNAAGQVQAEA